MIRAAHTIVYTTDAEADRAFFRDVLELDNIDVGGGWLIFKMPPSEVAFHPAEEGRHELYLVVDDIEAFVAQMKAHDVPCTEISKEGWGDLTAITLPGGGELGVYQAHHPLAHD